MIASFAFISCSNDDDQYNSAIVGKWKITEVKDNYILYKYCMFIPFYNDYAKRFRFIFVPLHAN